MNIEQIYDQQIIKKNKFILDDEYIATNNEIANYVDKFKMIKMLNQHIYVQPPKYYLQNKNKKHNDDIISGLKTEIQRLNSLYDNNIYFVDISKKILSKDNNKHTYDVFTATVIEYNIVNLFDDLLSSNTGYMNPILLSNDHQLLKLYNMIDDMISISEIYTLTDNKNDIKYHNTLIKEIILLIYDYYFRKFNMNAMTTIYDEIRKIDSKISIYPYLKISDYLYNEKYHMSHENEILNIINLLIDQDLQLDCVIIHPDYIKEETKKINNCKLSFVKI